MIAKDLKIGDTFEEMTLSGPVVFEVTGFDGQGNYISKCVGFKGEPEIVSVDKYIEEELPFAIPDDELVGEEQPVVEEAKKTAPKKTTTKKKTTAKKTSKK